MKKIIIKEIDQFKSSVHKDKTISEYLIYLMENDVKLGCYSEIGEENKNLMVNELLLEHISASTNIENIIQEVNFEEFLKQ
jgi:hypothetical protein